nr:MAG TPA: hypothetical protein [Crassvirales sp.]
MGEILLLLFILHLTTLNKQVLTSRNKQVLTTNKKNKF